MIADRFAYIVWIIEANQKTLNPCRVSNIQSIAVNISGFLVK
jgi:hypothetical protein